MAFPIQAEFGRDGAIDKLVSELQAGLQRRTGSAGIDFLINNAGGGSYANTAGTREEFYDQTFALNLRTPFFLTLGGGSIMPLAPPNRRRLDLTQSDLFRDRARPMVVSRLRGWAWQGAIA